MSFNQFANLTKTEYFDDPVVRKIISEEKGNLGKAWTDSRHDNYTEKMEDLDEAYKGMFNRIENEAGYKVNKLYQWTDIESSDKLDEQLDVN